MSNRSPRFYPSLAFAALLVGMAWEGQSFAALDISQGPAAIANQQPTADPVPTSASDPAAEASFGPIAFAAGVTAEGKPTDPLAWFPEGVTKIYGSYAYDGMHDGVSWTTLWTLDGIEYLRVAGDWRSGAKGTAWSGLYHPDGLPAGNYELRQFLSDREVLRGGIVIEGREAGQPFFGPIRFAEGLEDERPVKPHAVPERFRAGTTRVYAFFDAGNMAMGLPYLREWYRDGILDVRRAETWSGDPTEENWWAALAADDGLSPATYELRLFLNGTLAQLGTFVVERPIIYLPIAWRAR